MPQIGWFEILIIVVLALVIIGPKDLPIVLKKIGTWIGTFKNYFSEVQQDITDIEDSVEREVSLDKELSANDNNKKKNE
jgi:sec-independent protein translocase protein TatB